MLTRIIYKQRIKYLELKTKEQQIKTKEEEFSHFTEGNVKTCMES